jgi:multimeric flavodoxin WrbA
MKALVLSSSPRRNGNSAALAQAVFRGLTEAEHMARFVYVDDIVSSFLKDCRQCRRDDGECSIEDGFRNVFIEHFLPADGFVVATPIYWYGMSSQLKAFFDRMFCYVAASHPRSADVV